MPYINVTIGPDGKAFVEGEGFEGKQCHDVLPAYNDVLGAVKSTREHSDKKRVDIRVGK